MLRFLIFVRKGYCFLEPFFNSASKLTDRHIIQISLTFDVSIQKDYIPIFRDGAKAENFTSEPLLCLFSLINDMRPFNRGQD